MRKFIVVGALAIVAGALSLNSCKKANDLGQLAETPSTIPGGSSNNALTGSDFSYTFGDDPQCFHCYYCTAPKTDCTKIRPTTLAAGSYGKTALSADVTDFIDAVEKHTEKEFFKSNKWQSFLPQLTTAERKATLEELKSGKLKFVKLNSSQGNSIYSAVASSVTVGRFNKANSRFAVEITNN